MRTRLATRVGWLVISLLVVGALLAPLVANDRPLILSTTSGLSFPAAGSLPVLGRILDRPAWSTVDWRRSQPGERWRLAAPVPYSYRQIDLQGRLAPPSATHLMGTDGLGRDLAARVLHGATISLEVGLISTGLALGIGVLLGALAGFLGGGVDFVVSRAIETFLCFPTFFLILAVLAFRPPSMALLFVVIGLTRWPGFARFTRAEVLRLRDIVFVDAARVAGARPGRILFRHVLPHALTPALVTATFSLAGAMLVEAGLSFLGFGVPEPLPSWGGLLSEAQGSGRWWLVVFPGLALTLAVTGTQLLGEDLRDRLDPKEWPDRVPDPGQSRPRRWKPGGGGAI